MILWNGTPGDLPLLNSTWDLEKRHFYKDRFRENKKRLKDINFANCFEGGTKVENLAFICLFDIKFNPIETYLPLNKIQYFPFINISGITNGGMDLLPKDGPTPWLKLKINTAQSPILGLTTVVFYA